MNEYLVLVKYKLYDVTNNVYGNIQTFTTAINAKDEGQAISLVSNTFNSLSNAIFSVPSAIDPSIIGQRPYLVVLETTTIIPT